MHVENAFKEQNSKERKATILNLTDMKERRIDTNDISRYSEIPQRSLKIMRSLFHS
jgi:hypothetical protein